MRIERLLLALFLPAMALAQMPDVDGLAHSLDFSILDTATSLPPPPLEVPANHLLVNLDLLPHPKPEPKQLLPTDQEGLFRIELPAAEYLVAPNPPRMDEAYALLAQAVDQLKLDVCFPLKVLLHADGNFSVALALKAPLGESLPEGLDLSPMPKEVFAAVEADIQLLRKTEPPILDAYLRLQQAATRQGWDLDRHEFYFFPQSPGKVWFALRVINDTKPALSSAQKEPTP